MPPFFWPLCLILEPLSIHGALSSHRLLLHLKWREDCAVFPLDSGFYLLSLQLIKTYKVHTLVRYFSVLFHSVLHYPEREHYQTIPTGPWTEIASVRKTMRFWFLILQLPESYFQGNRIRDAVFPLFTWNHYFPMKALSEMSVSCSVASVLQTGWATAAEMEMQRGRGPHKSSADHCATLARASGKSNWKHTSA